MNIVNESLPALNKILLWVKTRKVLTLLILIILLAAFLRFFKLDQVPPSLNWDEADAGYNAYVIANWGKDEWGKTLPLIFTSFKDDKHPVHIYLTAPVVKLFGLSDFTTRLPGAFVGVLSVLVIFYLARILFNSNTVALFSALFLAVSPYHLQFSRGLWEVNFALFFFLSGLLMFYLAIQKKGWLINLSFLCFGISILSYHSSKVVVPVIVILLITLYFNKLRNLSLNFYSGIFILIVFIAFLIIDPRLIGFARANQTRYGFEAIEQTRIYKKTQNTLLGFLEIASNNYLAHFTSQYLFLSGDQSPRNSIKTYGEFYKIDTLFIFVGFLYLLKLRSKVSLVIFTWLLISPLPASVVGGAPSATRAIFMLGCLNLIAALGAGNTVEWFKGKARLSVLVFLIAILSMLLFSYLNYYYKSFPKKEATDWQYGMKQIVEYVKLHPEYNQVYVTDIRSQPYIFFLFHLKTPLPEFLNTVIYNRSESKAYSAVANFNKYYFGNWDPIESLPLEGILYVLTPSQYDGLRHRQSFDIKKVIYYPDGGTDFFLVSKKQ